MRYMEGKDKKVQNHLHRYILLFITLKAILYIFEQAQKVQKWVVLYSFREIYIFKEEYNLTQKLSFEKARSNLTNS